MRVVENLYDSLNRPSKVVFFALFSPLLLLTPGFRLRFKFYRQSTKDRLNAVWVNLIGWWEETKSDLIIKWNRLRGTPIPTSLMYAVTGSDDMYWFLTTGKLSAQSIIKVLRDNRLRLKDFDAVLDFGCGVGRVIRYFKGTRGTELHGCDLNSELIFWCDRNLSFAKFKTNGLAAQLAYEDEKFDFIYALSVFTHLREERQEFWMAELERVLKPGGYLLLTTHSSNHYHDHIQPEDLPLFMDGEMILYGAEHEGGNLCTVFHPYSYVINQLASRFEFVDHVAEGALGNPKQDIFLLRKPTTRLPEKIEHMAAVT